MKTYIIFILSLLAIVFCPAQEKTVEAKGVGLNRQEALDNALRAAVQQAVGVAVTSETEVENFMTIRDAVSTRSSGYVTAYTVVQETPLAKTFEVVINGTVSLAPLKQDALALGQMLGGLKFIVVYDERKLSAEENHYASFAYERMNERLSMAKYKYTEATLFESVLKLLPENDTTEVNFLNKLGLYTNSEFIIQLKNTRLVVEQKAAGVYAAKAVMDVKAYDNCNFHGLGTVVMESNWQSHNDKETAMRNAISEAILLGYDRLMLLFNQEIGSWVNNGAPYELRFYTDVRYGEFSAFKNLLKKDSHFGGEMQMLSAGTAYKKITLSYRLKQDELIDAVMASIGEIDGLKAKDLEPVIIYGRQISLTPYNTDIPEIREKLEILKKINGQ